MTKQLYIQILRRHYGLVVLCALMAMAIAFFVTMLSPLNYSATTQVMIIQKQLSDSDSYLAAKASEKIATNLTQVLYSTSFFEKVRDSGLVDLSKIDQLDETQKRKAWQETVSTQVISNTGILEITAYDPDPKQAEALASAIASTLTTQGAEYHGGGDNIQIMEINAPLTSKYPVKPNLVMNLALAFALGLASSLVYLFLRPEVKISFPALTNQKVKAKQIKEKEIPVAAPEIKPEIEKVLGMPVINQPALNYSVLDHATYPKYETIKYTDAPRVSTMFDHISASPHTPLH